MMTLKLLLNIQMICKMFKKILKNKILEKKRKIIIVFDDMIADMVNNDKKLNPIVTELFIRGKKLHISIFFITQSYFKVPKDVRLNTTPFLL